MGDIIYYYVAAAIPDILYYVADISKFCDNTA